MLENMSTLQLFILLGASVLIFVFILFLLLPGKEEKGGKKPKPPEVRYGIPPAKQVVSPPRRDYVGPAETDHSVLVAVISEKIDELSKRLNEYSETMKKIEETNYELSKRYEARLMELSKVLERIESGLTQSGGDKEMIARLTEQIKGLEEKISKAAPEKAEITEVKDRLNEVVTILKTLGS